MGLVFALLAYLTVVLAYLTPTILSHTQLYSVALEVSGSSVWAREAADVAWCESTGNPLAIGDVGERGLWQVRPEFWGSVPRNPLAQAEQAYEIWKITRDWRYWTCGR